MQQEAICEKLCRTFLWHGSRVPAGGCHPGPQALVNDCRRQEEFERALEDCCIRWDDLA